MYKNHQITSHEGACHPRIAYLLQQHQVPVESARTRNRKRDGRRNTKYYKQTRELETPLDYHQDKLFINSA